MDAATRFASHCRFRISLERLPAGAVQGQWSLDALDVRYNKRYASTRSAVERSIGLLKGKFRRLFYLDVNDYRGVTYLIYACVVLHNFILLKNGIHEEDIVLDPRRRRTPDCTDGQRLTAVQKRQRIAQSLN
jgi:hypothetical protein